MDLGDLLGSVAGSSIDLSGVATRLGITEAQAKAGLRALVPMVAGAAQHNVRQEGGLDGLANAVANGRHDRYLDHPSLAADEDGLQDGRDILGHLLGSKETSREVAQRAAPKSALSPELLKKLLPIAGALFMAYLAKRAKTQPAPTPAPAPSSGGGGGGGIGDLLGRMLDKDGDGSFLDDLGGMLGGKR